MASNVLDSWTVVRRRIEQHHLPGMYLGRNVYHDSRNLAYAWQRQNRALTSQLWTRNIPILDQGSVGSCFVKGTRIRMIDGSERPIEDVRLGEYVLTAEGNAGRVVRTLLRDEESGVIRLGLWGHNHLRMTREHPVLTARGYVPAQELRIGDEIAMPRFRAALTTEAIQPRPLVTRKLRGNSVRLPEKIILNEAAGRLFGLWLAEGSADGTKVRWTYGNHEGDTLVPETVRLCREVLGVEAHSVQRPNRTWWVTVYGTPWSEVFKTLGGTRGEVKKPHPMLCSGAPEFLAAMLDGWLAGDGCYRHDGSAEGVTVSADLALAMFDIGQALGRHPVIDYRESPQNSAAKLRLPRWTLTFAPGQGRCRQDGTQVWRKVRQLTVEEYVGPVYDLTVESDHSYVAEGIGVHNCTGNAEDGTLGCDPCFGALPASHPALDENLALKIYSAAETIDGDGPFPPQDNGSSGPSAAKAAKALGLISGYLHCLSLADVLDALETHPVCIGSNWYDSMDSPDSSGLVAISANASVRGGHEYLCRGKDTDRQLVFLDNSWGTSFGVNGSFSYSYATLERLLAEQGDGTVSVPLTSPAPTPVPVPVPVPTPTPTPMPVPTDPADLALYRKTASWVQERHVGQNAAVAKDIKTWTKAKGF